MEASQVRTTQDLAQYLTEELGGIKLEHLLSTRVELAVKRAGEGLKLIKHNHYYEIWLTCNILKEQSKYIGTMLMKTSRKRVKGTTGWYHYDTYVGGFVLLDNENDEAIKDIREEYRAFVEDRSKDEALDNQYGAKFAAQLREHGFESMQEFAEFLKGASYRQSEMIREALPY